MPAAFGSERERLELFADAVDRPGRAVGSWDPMSWILIPVVLVLVCGGLLLRWATRWGSTSEERGRDLPGDVWLEDAPRPRVAMTRAVSLDAPPERVWPWIAQLGRGAGWYSVDWLDNGRRVSARHLVTWIPEPRLGDATAIGYLRHVDEGRSLAWWVDGVSFAGARARLVTSYVLELEGRETRLISRMSADAEGIMSGPALALFAIIDSIMAIHQLRGLRERIGGSGGESETPVDPETGARDQYQSYEVLYADGWNAGVAGTESADRWRRSAVEDGVLHESLRDEGPGGGRS